ncbi:MAG: hypothetical protein VXZ82_23490 [Planctomycetota bacterium]|nr:hypothetical protein [Planctomycetota bacterium]
MKHITTALTCLTLTVFLGCGAAKLPTIPVTGTVLVDDKPMEGVKVVFSPAAGSSGQSASGQTDAEGKYSLTTVDTGDGALAGDYEVAILKSTVEEDTLPKEMDPDDPAAMDAIYGALDTSKEGKTENMIAAKWNSPGTSGLKASVKEGGENNFEFKVTSK